MAISRRLRFEILRRDGHTCRYCGAMAPDVPLTVDHVIPTALGGSDEPSNLVAACQPCNAGKSSMPADAEIIEDVAKDALRWKRAMEQAAALRHSEQRLLNEMTDQFREEWKRFWYEEPAWTESVPAELIGDALVDNWRQVGNYSSHAHSYPVAIAAGVLSVMVERGYATAVRRDLRDLTRLSEVLGAPVERIEIVPGFKAPTPAPTGSRKFMEKRPFPLDPGWRSSVERFIELGLSGDEIKRLVGVTMGRRLANDERFRFFCGCCWRAITDLQEDARRIIESEGK
ncbi:MAG TPA: HNH endonuclease [Acidimicrobiales bacterium]|nr:HNH endonuclease [Acidimicrobiales bacterium]